MSRTNVVILYGGRSGEHEVSRISAASVIRRFDRTEFSLSLVGIDEQGVWHLQTEKTLKKVLDGEELELEKGAIVLAEPGKGLRTNGGSIEADCVFPVLHGSFGEDGSVQGFLETINLPYVGTSIVPSGLGFDKIKAKEIWTGNGIPVVPYKTILRHNYDGLNDKQQTAFLEECKSELDLPIFVKPCRGGSSVGINKAKTIDSLKAAINEAFSYDTEVLLETSVNAREIECSVLGDENPRSFPPGEVISHHDFYDYSGKYLDPQGASFDIPAKLEGSTLKRIGELAVSCYRLLGCDSLARVDFFVDRDSQDVYINEINTMPGFTSISMFPKMCEAGGLHYPELLKTLVELGIQRHKKRAALRYDYDGQE